MMGVFFAPKGHRLVFMEIDLYKHKSIKQISEAFLVLIMPISACINTRLAVGSDVIYIEFSTG